MRSQFTLWAQFLEVRLQLRMIVGARSTITLKLGTGMGLSERQSKAPRCKKLGGRDRPQIVRSLRQSEIRGIAYLSNKNAQNAVVA